MEIAFELPFSFHLKVLETDEQVPSMRVNIAFTADQFLNTFRYEGSLWIECSAWDVFAQALLTPTAGDALLTDMNDCFHLAIRTSKHGQELECSFEKEDIDGGRRVKFACACFLDDDKFAVIKNSFIDFERWW